MEWRDLKRMVLAILALNLLDVVWFAAKVMIFDSVERPDVDFQIMKNLVMAAMFVIVAAIREKRS